MTSRIPFGFERELIYRGRLRPDTTVYPDPSWISAWREQNFRPTSNRAIPQAWVLNLEGAVMSADALRDLVVPLGEGIRENRFGPSALFVATSSDAIRDMLEALAIKHRFPLFLIDSIEAPLTHALPVGPLSPTDLDVLEHLRSSGGVSTSAQLAKSNNLALAAASNRLAATYSKHFITRIERPKRQGNQYVDPRVAFSQRHTAIPTGADPINPHVSLPHAFRESLAAYAKAQNREPGELLADLWREHIVQNPENYDELAKEFRMIGELMKSNDRDALRAYAREAARKADEPAK